MEIKDLKKIKKLLVNYELILSKVLESGEGNILEKKYIRRYYNDTQDVLKLLNERINNK